MKLLPAPSPGVLALGLLLGAAGPVAARSGRIETDLRVLALFTNQDVAASALNPGNAFRIPDRSFQLHLRPDLHGDFGHLEVMAKPRIVTERESVSFGPGFEDDSGDTDVFLNEWRLRYRFGDELTASVGRENLQWGPAFMLSASNPFLASNGRQRPQFEVPGLDYARLVYAPTTHLSVSAITNLGEGRLDGLGTFRETHALKLDWTVEKMSFGLIGSHREGDPDAVGFYGLFNVTDALLAYLEGSTSSGDTSLLVGGSYTFRSGDVVALEHFRDGRGLLAPGADFFGSSAAASSLMGAGVPAPPADADYLMLLYSHGGLDHDFHWTLRTDQALDDDGARYLGIANWDRTDHLALFLNGILDERGTGTTFGTLIDRVVLVGAKYVF